MSTCDDGHGRPPTHRGCLGGLEFNDLNSRIKDLHPPNSPFRRNLRIAGRICKGVRRCDSGCVDRCCAYCERGCYGGCEGIAREDALHVMGLQAMRQGQGCLR